MQNEAADIIAIFVNIDIFITTNCTVSIPCFLQSETAIEIYRALLFAQFPGASEQLSLVCALKILILLSSNLDLIFP